MPAASDNKTCKTVAVQNELDGLRVVRSAGSADTVVVLTRITHAHLKSQLVRITEGGTVGARRPQPAAAAAEASNGGPMAAF